MNIALTILLILTGVVALLLLLALFMKKGYLTHSETTIEAPVDKTFTYLRQIKNQDNYNLWVMMDPAMHREFIGTDGTVGFIYRWNGNKQAGQGEQEIKTITEGKDIEMEIRFIRPFAGVAKARMATEPMSDGKTRVTWNTSSKMKYPLNLMLPLIVRMMEKDMGKSLTTLKQILEK